MRKSINVIGSVKEFGISVEDWKKNLKQIAANAYADPCTGFNPRKPTIEEFEQIFQACYDGAAVNF